MARAPTDIRSLARSHTEMAIKILAGIAKDGSNEGARVAAAVALLDRGWGKLPQAHTGEDGEGEVRVTIRHIVEGRDAPREVAAPPPSVNNVVTFDPKKLIDAAKNDDGS
jgi:hypothetical protein